MLKNLQYIMLLIRKNRDMKILNNNSRPISLKFIDNKFEKGFQFSIYHCICGNLSQINLLTFMALIVKLQ